MVNPFYVALARRASGYGLVHLQSIAHACNYSINKGKWSLCKIIVIMLAYGGYSRN